MPRESAILKGLFQNSMVMQPVPVEPWIVKAGRSAMRYHVYVYEADDWGLTLGASNGSLDGMPLMRYWLRVARFALEDAGFDVADYAAREIRSCVDAGASRVFS
jgi:predicted membrane-bound spermidine synthase